jgi:hypothetical protein
LISVLRTHLVHSFLVIIELVGPHARSGLEHAGHVVVPLEPLLGVVPVHSPSEVARVDVRRQTVFKAMKLIWANEVHLSGQGGFISLSSQIVSISWNVRTQFRRIVVSLANG